ncbi:transmembrane protease serine 2 [Xenopus tropicalis]|uniref:Transmembrane protease serine 2 n=1 Tax=Xenopus tropicalis TaxID=8364 RepID=F7C223_XENTR|nr:transmembrane protease serine 2 [Xenopus tropicalis]
MEFDAHDPPAYSDIHHHDPPHYHEPAMHCEPPPYCEHEDAPHHHNVPHYPEPIPHNVYEASPESSPQYVPEVPSRSVAAHKNGALCNARSRKISRISAALCVLIAAIIIIAVLSWHFGTATKCQASCGSSSNCVLVSQWCDGVKHCPNGEDESSCLRMYGPNFQLQAYSASKATWLPVCADNWGDSIGRTACQDIGYSSSSYIKSNAVTAPASDGYVRLNNYAGTGNIFASLNYSSTCSSGLVVSLKCIDCGLSTYGESRIVGGSSASIGDWPWQVNLQYDDTNLCGGSVIAANWIVTAAHCVQGDTSSPSLWKAFIGKIKMPSYYDSSAYSVDRIIVHPDYSSQTNSNDIALMKLKTSIAFSSISRPVCLPNYGMQWEEGQPCYISGWGTTSQKGSISSVLKYAMVPLISPTTCNQTIMYNGAITSSMICAGYPKGGVDSCQGDSGGPLVTKTNSLWWLVGDTSWGDGCANVYRPGVYGNMTVFLQWIYLQMQMYS